MFEEQVWTRLDIILIQRYLRLRVYLKKDCEIGLKNESRNFDKNRAHRNVTNVKSTPYLHLKIKFDISNVGFV